MVLLTTSTIITNATKIQIRLFAEDIQQLLKKLKCLIKNHNWRENGKGISGFFYIYKDFSLTVHRRQSS